MGWDRIGCFLAPDDAPWVRSHPANPVAQAVDSRTERIWFSARDEEGRSSIGWVDLDPSSPRESARVSSTPELAPGPVGTFDDDGVSMGSLLDVDGGTYLYYLGWNRATSVPFRNSVGAAFRPDGAEAFEKVSRAPILDRNDLDPFTVSYPCVADFRSDEATYRMWYGTHLTTGPTEHDMTHAIRSADSNDAVTWTPSAELCLEPAGNGEHALARPWVVRDGDIWRMWFSFRGEQYAIGSATSVDGRVWQRDDAAGLRGDAQSWEQGSVCYASVFDHDDARYLLYSAGRYGAAGLGIAVWDDARS